MKCGGEEKGSVGCLPVCPCAKWGEIKLTSTSDTTCLHDTMATTKVNGDASDMPIEIAVPLPKSPRTNINLRLHNNGPNITLFLTTSTPDAASSVPLGSLVYAMPNASIYIFRIRLARTDNVLQRAIPSQPLSTPLFTHSATLDFTTRLSKVLARKTGKPIYVSSSMSFVDTGMGGTFEEEMEGFKRVVEVVMCALNKEVGAGS